MPPPERHRGPRRAPRATTLMVIILAPALLVAGACSSDVEVRPISSGAGDGPPVTVIQPAPLPRTTSTTAPPAVVRADDPAHRFVSPALGDDGADGRSPETPWASLQGSLDRLAPGQTLYLLDGRYRDETEPGNSHHIVKVSGTPEDWIRITAAPGHHPVVVAGNGNAIEIRGDYVEVTGLEVMGEGFDEANHYGWGFMIRNSHHVRVAGNTVSAMAVGGISSVESTNLEIDGNVVYENSFWGPEQGSGISMWHLTDASGVGPDNDGYHNRIVGNVVYRNENKVFSRWRDHDVITDGNGIIVDQADETGYTGRTLVANNLVFDNGGRGILVLESSRVDVMFNTSYHNARTDGLEGGPVELAAARASDVRFVNNLAWSRPGGPAVAMSQATGILMGGNVLVTDSPSGLATELDRVMGRDPGLVQPGTDESQADFHPVAGSSLVDAAIDVSPMLGFDADLLPRSPGQADIGAYELTVR